MIKISKMNTQKNRVIKMKNKNTTIAQKFTKLASRVVQSIKPAFQALAQKATSVMPHFAREATPARAPFAMQPSPVKAMRTPQALRM